MFLEKTIALGGVAIGIINAQLAAKTTGRAKLKISKLFDDAKDITMGKNKSVVAVLLVISVKNEINKAIDNIISNKLKLFRKNKKSHPFARKDQKEKI